MRALRILKYELTYRYRSLVPWVTRGGLRSLLEMARTERDHLTEAVRHYHNGFTQTVGERDSERRAREKLETQRIAEHEALRQLCSGMVHNLEGSLALFSDFLQQMPDYTPDQSERDRVFRQLTEDELKAQS